MQTLYSSWALAFNINTESHNTLEIIHPEMWTAMSVRANTTLAAYTPLWWKGESERFSELECTCVLCARVCMSMCMRVCSGLWANDKLQIAIKFQCITSSMFVRVAFVLVCSVCVCVSSWCCILYYNNGINIWFTFIHYWMPTTKMKLSGNALWQKSHPSRLCTRWSGSNVSVCALRTLTYSDDDDGGGDGSCGVW